MTTKTFQWLLVEHFSFQTKHDEGRSTMGSRSGLYELDSNRQPRQGVCNSGKDYRRRMVDRLDGVFCLNSNPYGYGQGRHIYGRFGIRQ